MILIPVKNLSRAKQRLAAVLDQSARTELAQTMILDMLETLTHWQDRPDVSVVTSDPYTLELAKHFHLGVIRDDTNLSETGAVATATQLCEARGLESTLVIPGDIPLMKAEELEQILRVAPAEGSVLVPAADGRGTNAAFRRPAGLFSLRFGNDSFKPHLAAARAAQKPCVVLELPGIALDIDRPEDLQQLAVAPGETRSQRMVRAWGSLCLPQAACE